MPDWHDLISAQLEVHQKLIDAGYPYDPAVLNEPATEEQIRVAEERLGTRLADQHRELLKITNGWTEQHGFNSIFPVEDLGDGAIQLGAVAPVIYETPLHGSWLERMRNRDAAWELCTPIGDMPVPEGLHDWRWLYPIAEGIDSGGQVLACGIPPGYQASQRIYTTSTDPKLGFPDLKAYFAWCIDDDQQQLARMTATD
ncbi:SMI1/KNR4 family protein [Gordonia sp. NPDC003585]|uniref:SMI1/KNR4 family protein n=1 Tax=unclassified Gordonia (in: high G+C Gram-positive bacteria) TaxID=2657482 RepID=UPI0033B42F6A